MARLLDEVVVTLVALNSTVAEFVSGLLNAVVSTSLKVPPFTVTSAVSPVVSFFNLKTETLPPALAVGISSLPVSYLNLKTELLPAELHDSAVSPLVIYRNIPPAASASVNPPAPLAPKSLSSN